MMHREADPIAELDGFSRGQLVERYKQLFNRPVPKGMSQPLLFRIVAYRIQENANGGPDRALKRRLAKLAREVQTSGDVTTTPIPRIKPGTRFLREWQGSTHTVTVTDEGFQYGDRSFSSLSAIAREITGTRWSGPAFFGLKGRKGSQEGSHAG